MKFQHFMFLALLVFLSITYGENAAVELPWGCSNYNGVCRPICQAAELPFGPFGCAKGFVCCVAHVY
ncbi:defensin, beta-like 1 [Clupea harengus]|uniref:Defensin, beta-like 1 n=1 Tax=Clupea harengus TaxID=7950 RepID=A0A8M1KQJ8_CLUHA|nr:defensin, beta-like 1 [Clupea harengus]